LRHSAEKRLFWLIPPGGTLPREHFSLRSAISQLSRRFAETIKGNQEFNNIEKESLLNIAACPVSFLPFCCTLEVKVERYSVLNL
jgi:hypothetical protein